MRRLLTLLLLASLAPACATAHSTPRAAASSRLAEVTLYDASEGRELPLYRHRGRLYAAGEPGHEYRIHVRSRTGNRLLAVTSVDGVNVVSGEDASPDQTGYVLDGYGAVAIEGWRKSLERIASFYFTELPDSYAARTGRPDDVGVIGVALFEERVHRAPPPWRHYEQGDAAGSRDSTPGAAAPPASPQSRSSTAEESLGTGHGRSQWSAAHHVEFERASDRPAEIIRIYYDSRRNLAALGIVDPPRRWAHSDPDPFPGGFVPDP